MASYSSQLGNLKEAYAWLDKAIDKGGDGIKLVALDDKELEAIWLDISEI